MRCRSRVDRASCAGCKRVFANAARSASAASCRASGFARRCTASPTRSARRLRAQRREGVWIEIEGATAASSASSPSSRGAAPPRRAIDRSRPRPIAPRGEPRVPHRRRARRRATAARRAPRFPPTSRRATLPARARRSGRPPLPLSVHQLHRLRPALHDRPRRSRTTARDHDGRVRAVRGVPRASTTTRATAAFTPSPTRARRAARSSRSSARAHARARARPRSRAAAARSPRARSSRSRAPAASSSRSTRRNEPPSRGCARASAGPHKPFAVMARVARGRRAHRRRRRPRRARALPRRRGRSCSCRARRAGRSRRASRRARRGRRVPARRRRCSTCCSPTARRSGDDQRQPSPTSRSRATNDEALARLGSIADAFLSTTARSTRAPTTRSSRDRRRGARCPMRRARGYVPARSRCRVAGPAVLAVGGRAEEHGLPRARRAGRAVAAHRRSRPPGRATRSSRRRSRSSTQLLGVTPEAVAHDLHPDYRSTRWARAPGLPRDRACSTITRTSRRASPSTAAPAA